MRFLFTMNMPSAKGQLVHQLIVDHPCQSIGDMCALLNATEYIVVRQLYKNSLNISVQWEDRGEMILNTHAIGKVQEFHERGYSNFEDSSQGNSAYNTRQKDR